MGIKSAPDSARRVQIFYVIYEVHKIKSTVFFRNVFIKKRWYITNFRDCSCAPLLPGSTAYVLPLLVEVQGKIIGEIIMAQNNIRSYGKRKIQQFLGNIKMYPGFIT
jgi:hypothetical protein